MSYDTITLRELVGGVLVEAGKENKDIYVIDSDLAKSTTTNQFEEVFPERFVETGIAEQNAMSIAAGIATEGRIPFYVNFAIFVSGTCWTQLRQICYANLNVKLIATHPGMDGGYDGATRARYTSAACGMPCPICRRKKRCRWGKRWSWRTTATISR